MVSRPPLPAGVQQKAVTLVDVLRFRAQAQGQKTAFRFLKKGANPPTDISYQALDRYAQDIAAQLQIHHQPGDRVMLLFPPGLDYIAAFMGCLYAGMVAVPLYPPRPNQKLYRAGKVIADAQPSLALTDSESYAVIRAYFDASESFTTLKVLATDSLKNQGLSWTQPKLTANHLAFLQYTSGSTGDPKGVMVSHGNIVANAETMAEASQVQPDDVAVSWLPIYHDMGLIGMVLEAIYSGFTTMLLPAADFIRDPIWWLEVISDYGATISGSPNFGYTLCCERITPERLAGLDLSRWRLAFNGAEPIKAETLTKFAECFAQANFQSQAYFPCYGMAETTLFVSACPLSQHPSLLHVDTTALSRNEVQTHDLAQKHTQTFVGCGHTFLTDQVVIAHPQSQQAMPEGQVGEIWVQSTGKALGYWNQPQLSEQVFKAKLSNASNPTEFLKTGDLGFLLNGELFITGRLKDLLIFRGRNHYPQDLEQTAERSHAALAINACAAFAVPHEDNDRLIIAIEIKRTAVRSFNPAEVFAAIRQNISERHELTVHDIVLLKPGRIPKTSSGKIQRNATKNAYIKRDLALLAQVGLSAGRNTVIQPEHNRSALLAAKHAEGLIAEQIHRWISAFLDLDPQTFNHESSLTALGMSSMAAITLQHKIETVWQMKIPLSFILSGNTINQLAQQCAENLEHQPEDIAQVPQNHPQTFPLSPNQQALWQFLKLHPQSTAYNLPYAMELNMPLDPQALRKVFETLLQRHRMLRAVIQVIENQPVWHIPTQIHLPFEFTDASTWSPEAVEAHIEKRVQHHFDLANGPLFFIECLQTEPSRFVLMVNMSHLIGDMWSLLVLLEDMRTLYSNRGDQALLTPLASDYASHAANSLNFINTDQGQKQLDYWRTQLGQELPTLALPSDFPRPQQQTTKGATTSIRLGKALHQSLHQLAKTCRVTPSTLFLTAFQTSLHRYSAQKKVIVGLPFNRRNGSAHAQTLGYFINPLAIVSNAQPSIRFEQMLQNTHQTVQQAIANGELAFHHLLKQLEIERDPSRTPLFQTMFAYQEPHEVPGAGAIALREPKMAINWGEFSMQTIGLDPKIALFDLTLFVAEIDGDTVAQFEYNTDLFLESTIQAFAQHWHDFLANLPLNLTMPVNQISPVSSREELLLERFSRTGAPPSVNIPAHLQFLEQAKLNPTQVAIVDGNRTTSYQALTEKAWALSQALTMKGVGPGSLVGLCFPRSTELIQAALATLFAGGTYVPMDPQYPAERLTAMVEDSGISLVLGFQETLALLDLQRVTSLQAETWPPACQNVPHAEQLARIANLEQIAYVIFTSGSTGKPKGVAIPHRGLANLIAWHARDFKLKPGVHCGVTASPGFDASVWEIWPVLATGGTLHMMPAQLSTHPEGLRDWIVNQQLEVTFLATPLAEAMLHMEWVKETTLRCLLTGGDKLRTQAKNTLPFELVNNYGPTENSVVATSMRIHEGDQQPPIGFPIDGVTCYVTNQSLQPVPLGAAGELCLSGASQAMGYLKQAALTAEAFVPNPFAKDKNHSRLYKTGDLVRFDRLGTLHFLGRIDQQVKLRGFRIELGDIETSLRSMSGVRDCLVLMSKDAKGQPRLTAYLIGAPASPSDLREALLKRLPNYMVPHAFVTLAQFPLTSNGKINRQKLPQPSREHLAVANSLILPRNPTEAKLCTIWQEILPVEAVGIHDNFFELGGDSILAIQIITQARLANIHLAPSDVFHNQTIASLAKVAGKTKRRIEGQEISAEPVMPTPIQLAFLESRSAVPEHFNQSVLLEVASTLKSEHLNQALDQLHLHHDSLRLRFDLQGTAPIHYVASGKALLETIVFQGEPEQLQPWVFNQTQRLQESFNLKQGPLVAAGYFKLPNQAHNLLFLSVHHLVIDGVSWRILLEDMTSLLNQLSQNLPLALPEKTTSLQAWSNRIQEPKGSLDYWKTWPSTTAPARLGLAQKTQPSVATAKIKTLKVDRATIDRLSQQTASLYRLGLQDVLLASLVRTLGTLKQSWDLVLDLESHGREQELYPDMDLSRTIGWFTSVYSARFHLQANGGPADDLLAIKDQLRAVPHRGLFFPHVKQKHTAPDIVFNYLGRFDQALHAPFLGTSSLETAGDRAAGNLRTHTLELDAMVVEQGLQLRITYCSEAITEPEINQFLNLFHQQINTYAAFCNQPQTMRWSPSDFPYTTISQADLDALVEDSTPLADMYPLSPVQEGMLFHALLEDGSCAYFEQLTAQFEGDLNPQAFRQAWCGMLEQIPVLATRFAWENLTTPMQLVMAETEPEWVLTDLVDKDANTQTRLLTQFLDQDRQRGFSLSQGPLTRFALFKTGLTKWTFVWSYHHLLLDGWSMSLVLEEVLSHYRALIQKKDFQHRTRPPFRQFVTKVAQPISHATRQFWRQHLAGFSAPLVLPMAGKKSAPMAHLNRVFSKQLCDTLAHLGKHQGLTLSTCIQGAVSLLLAHYCRTNDVVFGLTVSGRESGDQNLSDMIGLLINTVPVRVKVPLQQTTTEWLAALQDQALAREPHSHMSLAKIQAESDLPSGEELFDTLLVVENYPLQADQLHRDLGFEVSHVHAAAHTHYGLTIVARAHAGLEFQIAYDSGKYTKPAMSRLLNHLEMVLGQLAENLNQPLHRIALLPSQEYETLVHAWNKTQPSRPTNQGIHQFFEEQVNRSPNAQAIYLPAHTRLDGTEVPSQAMTYAELNQAANIVATRLLAMGIQPETSVGLYVERSLELVSGLLGILKAGAAYVPLDPAYPEDRLTFMITDSELQWVICQKGLSQSLPAQQVHVLEWSVTEVVSAAIPNPQAPATIHQQTAYIIYTSGSTGKPKGVPVTHANVVRLFQTSQPLFHFDHTDVWTLFHSYAFDFTVWELWGALIHGGKLVIVPQMVARDANSFHLLLRNQQVTVLNQTPSAFVRLIQADETAPKCADRLRYVIFGGEALEPQSLQPWFSKYGDSKPQLVNMYGITETTVHVTFCAIHQSDSTRHGSLLGTRLPDLNLYLLNNQLKPVPQGVNGEIFVGGAGVARGYLNRPALTATRFLPDPYAAHPGARIYRSGDLGRFREAKPGQIAGLEYAGRCDFQVKIRGYRIELGEIEAALLNIEAVRDAVVLARDDAAGAKDKQLVAYLTGDLTHIPSSEALHDALNQTLPDYMIPSHFMRLDSLPLTTHGKVDRRKLPAPTISNHQHAVLVTPRNKTEQLLVEIWKDVLKLEKVGVHQRFFELGGDSILSIRIMTAAKRLGIGFSLQQLFKLQTIGNLAAVAELKTASSETRLAPFALLSEQDRQQLPTGLADAYPATLLQKGMLFHGEKEADAYHNLTSFHLELAFHQQAFEAAVATVLSRHPVLRTSFDLTHFSQPMQLVHTQIATPVTVHDLTHLQPSAQQQSFSEWFTHECHQTFQWNQPGLLRFHVHRFDGNRFQVTLTEHHAILDGWSVASLLSEVFSFYLAAFTPTIAPPPKAPTSTFANFVALEQASLQSDSSPRFWADHLDNFEFTRIPRLPGDDHGPTHLEVPIEPALSNQIQALAQRWQVPLKSVCLAVHFRTLALLSGKKDLLTGVVANGRPETEDGTQMLGLFLNTLPMRFKLGHTTWRDLVVAVFQAEQNALPHRRYPLAEIQRMFGNKPLFETAFNYTHFHIYQSVQQVEGLKVLDTRFHAPTHIPFAANFSRDLDTGNLLLSLDYRAEVFSHGQVEAMGGFYQTALQHLADHSDSHCHTIDFLKGSQRIKVLETWNQTTVPRPSSLTGLHQLVSCQAIKRADKTAIIALTPTGETQRLSYGELEQQSSQLAQLLIAKGVKPDQPVGLCMRRSPQAMVAMLGILKAGCGYMPMDPGYPDERLAFMLKDSGANWVVTTADHHARFTPLCNVMVPEKAVHELAQQPIANPELAIHPQSMAYIIYTSGSTGTPKGVVISHGAILNQIFWRQQVFDLDEHDRLLQNLSLSFDPSVWQIFWPLSIGAQLYLIPNDAQRDIPWLAQLIWEHKLSATAMVPSVLRVLLEQEAFLKSTHLKHISCGGEGLPADLVTSFCNHFGEHGILHVVYGPTEATIDASTWHARSCVPTKIAPIGLPIHNAQLYVLDEQLAPVPPGVPGELYIAGAGLGRGYLQRPALTADRYIPNPFDTGGTRLYRSGDLVRYLHNGVLEFLGRVDHQVKVRGFRIELGELEAVLSSHDQISEVVCLVREDQPGEKRLVAYLKGTLGDSSLRSWLANRVPEYMVPAVFVEMDEFPRLPNDKINRAQLPKPEAADSQNNSAYVAPRTELEMHLTQIWEAVLNLDKVGIEDNFFELGGDSILSLQIIARAREAGFHFSPKDLFENQTIAALAGVAKRKSAVQAQQGPIAGPAKLAPIQQWFLEKGAPHHFNQSVLLEMPLAFSPEAVERALQTLVDHHDGLRLFLEQDASNQWHQHHAPIGTKLPFARIVIDGNAHDWEKELEAHADFEQFQFNLNKPPLLRGLFFELHQADQHHATKLFLIAHHLVVDGVSWRILLEDLQMLFAQMQAKQPLNLPPKTTAFRDWTAKLHALAGTDAVLTELDYWQGNHGERFLQPDVPHRLEDNTVGHSAILKIELDATYTQALLQKVPAVYQTRIDDVLLAALGLAWREWANHDALQLDLESHGRSNLWEDVDLSRTIGWFTSAFPITLSASAPKLSDHLKAVKEQLRSVQNLGISYGLLRYLNPATQPRLAEQPASQVAFNYLGRLDQQPQQTGFRLLEEPTGNPHDPNLKRSYLFEFNSFVKHNSLQIQLTWPSKLFFPERIKTLANTYLAKLKQLIDHCLLPNTGGRTPSDYPLVTLNQEDVDLLVGDGGNVTDIFPLAPTQQDILFHVMLQQGGLFHQQLHFVIEQSLDVPQFQAAWAHTVQRFASLRASFHGAPLDTPVQMIAQDVSLPWTLEDWSHKNQDHQTQDLTAYLSQDRNNPFALDQAPLMRLALFKLGSARYQFVWSHHHLLSDGWSLPLILGEVLTQYQQSPTATIPVAYPFRNYLAWLKDQDQTAMEQWWQQHLAGFAEATPLPLDRLTYGESKGPTHGHVQRTFSKPETATITQLTRTHRLTVNTLLQGAWAALLARFSGRDDVVFGASVSGRPADLNGVEAMVGLFINTLPVRTQLKPHQSLLSWLEELQDCMREMERRSPTPAARIRAQSSISGGLPLYESLVIFENYPVDDSLREQGFQITDFVVSEQTNFPLALTAELSGGQLSLNLTYHRNRYQQDLATQILNSLTTLLQAMVNLETKQVCDLKLVEPSHYPQLLSLGTGPKIPTSHGCLHDMFDAWASKSPETIAVISPHENGAETLTYGQLHLQSNGLACALAARGYAHGTNVGIYLGKSCTLAVAVLGVMKAGATYVPLDPDYPHDRLQAMVQQADVNVILTNQELHHSAPLTVAHSFVLDQDTTWNHLQGSLPQVHPNQVAYLMFSSGSTGTPKGIAISHRSLVHAANGWESAYQLRTNCKVHLQMAAFSFDVFAGDFARALTSGASLVFCPKTYLLEPHKLWQLIETYQVDAAEFVPAVIREIMAYVTEQGTDFHQFNLVAVGSDTWNVGEAKALAALCDSNCLVVNSYGVTEATIDSTYLHIHTLEAPNSRSVPIGKPFGNTQVFILDTKLQPVPPGVFGNLFISGPGLAMGYLGLPRETATKFMPLPFGDEGQRMYRTDDAARFLPNGTIEFAGRLDFQVKIRGLRIELGDIETSLRNLPGIDQTVVVLRKDAPQQIGPQLVAYLVGDVVPEAAVLKQALRKRLPDYMVPHYFQTLSQMPLTANGKVNRRALPAPDWSLAGLEKIAPRNELEQQLADIWETVLGTTIHSVEANFFDLGGHSLMATRVISRIRKQMGLDISLRRLFECPTIAQLAKTLSNDGETAALDLPLLTPSEAAPVLSQGQKRLWFIDQMAGPSAAYNLGFGLRLKGELNLVALHDAFLAMIDRHQSLRTRVFEDKGQPWPSHVQTPSNWEIPLLDLSHAQDPEAQAMALFHQQTEQPFDLATEWLLRLQLLRLNHNDHLLVVTMHHIISDAWSIGIMVRELSALYAAKLTGKTHSLPALPLQYADFAHWQQQLLAHAALEKQLHWWKTQLANAPQTLALPFDRLRPKLRTTPGASLRFSIGREHTNAIKQLANETGTTLFMNLIGAYALLLGRYANTHDVVVGTPIANRNQADLETMIGFFVNTLALRFDLKQTTWREQLAAIRTITLGAYAHQDLPFEQLVDALDVPRDLSHEPVFQVMFSLQNALTSQLELPGLEVSALMPQTQTARFDMLLVLEETPTGLEGIWEYNSYLFDASTIENMVTHYSTLLEQLVSQPDAPLSNLSLEHHEQRTARLHKVNTGQSSLPAPSGLALFEQQAHLQPDQIAVINHDLAISYGTLNATANQLAHHLKSKGLRPGNGLGIQASRTLTTIIQQLAIWKCGAYFIPLDTRLPLDRLKMMVADTQPWRILCQQADRSIFEALGVSLEVLDQFTPFDSPKQNLGLAALPQQPAYVMFTSGSTGKPKGVAVPHSGIASLVSHLDYVPLSKEDTVLHFASPAFDATTFEVWAALAQGARIALFPDGPSDVASLIDFMSSQGVTVCFITGGFFNAMVDHGFKTLPHLRYLMTGGETLSPPHALQFIQHHPTTQLTNIYGPTEATTFATNQVLTIEELKGRAPIGKAVAQRQVFITSGNLNLNAQGELGELCISGQGLASGYVNRAKLTALRFVPNPFSTQPGSRLYRTGDLAFEDHRGTLIFCGRNDAQVKLRGFRIEIGDIEHHLNHHPQLNAAAVVLREDLPNGKGLVAFVESATQQESSLDPQELVNALRQNLPEYMIPSMFVQVDALPLNQNGKVDRKTLKALSLSGRLNTQNDFQPPRNKFEEALADIWADLLGLENVSVHANFFENGGHSLLATQAISRIRTHFQIEAPLRELFDKPSIAQLASWIAQQQQLPTLPALTARESHATTPLSYAQQRLWFLDQMERQSGNLSGTYNIHAALELEGELAIEALRNALDRLVMRHDVLRTNFAETLGTPQQIIHPQPTVELLEIHTSAMSAETLDDLKHQEASKGFDLAHDPLLRLTLLHIENGNHQLLLTMHHIISDGWSMGILVDELMTFYRLENDPSLPEPAPLALQYADFACWQQQASVQANLEQQAQWWRTQLKHLPSCHQMPTDKPRPAIQTHSGRHLQTTLPKHVLEQLESLAKAQDVTLFMVLLAAFKVLIWRYSDQEDLAVGTPIANRNRGEIEPLIGFFVNTLVMRSQIQPNQSFTSFLGNIKATALDAYAHQDVPFEQVVEVIGAPRNLSHAPLFQIMFAMQNQAMAELELEGLTLTPLPTEVPVAKFDLTLDVRTGEEGLTAVWEYNTDLFKTETINTIANYYTRLLGVILANPNQTISQLDCLDPAKRSFLLQHINQTQKNLPLSRGVHSFFEDHAAKQPHQTALLFDAPEAPVTYGELNASANQLARFLRSKGIGHGSKVGLLIDRSAHMLTGVLAILKAGAAYLPLDPEAPEPRRLHILADSGLDLVLSHTTLQHLLPPSQPVLCLDNHDWQTGLAEDLNLPVLPHQPAYLIYTSGSTGKPKASVNTHVGLTNHNLWLQQAFPLTPSDRVALKTPFEFDVSAWETFWPLMAGASVAVAAPGKQGDPYYLRQWLLDQKVTAIYFVASMLSAFVESLDEQVFDSSLRFLFTGGEALSPQVRNKALALITNKRQPIAIENTYGPSEAAISCAHFRCGTRQLEEAIPLGKPIANMQAYVVRQDLQLVPQGVPGELVIAGVNLSHGYLKRASLTASRFIPNPFATQPHNSRLYRTGDLVRMLPDGDLVFLGRVDEQVKLRGMRIELGDIATCLASHPHIEAAKALVVNQPNGQHLVGFLKHQPDRWDGLQENLGSWLKQQLPAHMVPNSFVSISEWPRLPSGKINKNALAQMALNQGHTLNRAAYLAPRNDIEASLVAIWEEVLGVEKVGVMDNFFEIGGHSLLATQVLSRIRSQFPEGLSLQFLFEEPTVAGIARGIENIRKTIMVEDFDEDEDLEEFEF